MDVHQQTEEAEIENRGAGSVSPEEAKMYIYIKYRDLFTHF